MPGGEKLTAGGPVLVDRGRGQTSRKSLISMIISESFACLFRSNGPAFVRRSATTKKTEILLISRRCGVSIAGRPWWRGQSHPVKANQTKNVFFAAWRLAPLRFAFATGRANERKDAKAQRRIGGEIPLKSAHRGHEIFRGKLALNCAKLRMRNFWILGGAAPAAVGAGAVRLSKPSGLMDLSGSH